MSDTVVKADPPGKPAPEAKSEAPEAPAKGKGNGSDAPNLDAALQEFDAARPKVAEPQPAPREPTREEQATAERAYQLLESRMSTDRDIAAAVKQVRGDFKFDDEFMEIYLHGLAIKRPQFREAFLARSKAPAAWNKLLKAAQADFAKRIAPPVDQNATVDRAGIREASRRASTVPPPRTSGPDPKIMRKMTDTEFSHYKKTGQIPDRLKGAA